MSSGVSINDHGGGFYTATAPNQKEGFVYEFTAGEAPRFDPSDQFAKPTTVTATRQGIKKETIKFASWGKDNKLPNHLLNLLLNNNLAPGVMDTKDQILVGDDLVFYYELFDKGKKIKVPCYVPELEDWLEEIEAFQFLEEAAIDYNWFSNIFAKLSYGNAAGGKKDKITKIRHIDAVDCRASIMDPEAKRSLYYGIGDWSQTNKDVDILDAYDPTDTKQAQEFVLHMKKRTPGNPYYPLPPYIGAQHWLRHANRIPIWKISNMENAANIKYHIQIPERYFMNLYPDTAGFSREDRATKRKQLIDHITEILSGAENVAKTFYSEFAVDAMSGKELPGWKIEAIDNKINHEAYSKDFADANSAILSAMSLDSSLSGVMLPGNLGGGAGSKDREAYNIALKKTRYGRALMLRPFDLGMRINKTNLQQVDGQKRRIYLGIQDEIFQTLDANPTGKTNAF